MKKYQCNYCKNDFDNKKSMTNHRRHHYNGFTQKWITTRKNNGLPWVSDAHKKKIGELNKGERNGMWKGDGVGLISLHEWIRNHKPKPDVCESCENKRPFDLANISGEYKRDINDFKWMCRSCHMKMDYKNGTRSKIGDKNAILPSMQIK